MRDPVGLAAGYRIAIGQIEVELPTPFIVSYLVSKVPRSLHGGSHLMITRREAHLCSSYLILHPSETQCRVSYARCCTVHRCIATLASGWPRRWAARVGASPGAGRQAVVPAVRPHNCLVRAADA